MTICPTLSKWVLPMTVKDKEILGIEPGNDLEVKIIVRERKSNTE